MEKMRSMIYGDIGEITEADIAKYYNDHRDEFYFPDQIRAFAIALKTKKEATELLERIKGGANFMQLAQEYSVDKQSGALGGDLNLFSAARYPAIYKAAERLRIGDLGGPVEMEGNWWIFQLADRRNKSVKELDLARGDIRSQIGQDRRANLYNDWIATMKERITCKMNLDLVRENLRMGRLPETDTSKG
jgi:parvulin-like peptidyl-prolyl isomerase